MRTDCVCIYDTFRSANESVHFGKGNTNMLFFQETGLLYTRRVFRDIGCLTLIFPLRSRLGMVALVLFSVVHDFLLHSGMLLEMFHCCKSLDINIPSGLSRPSARKTVTLRHSWKSAESSSLYLQEVQVVQNHRSVDSPMDEPNTASQTSFVDGLHSTASTSPGSCVRRFVGTVVDFPVSC